RCEHLARSRRRGRRAVREVRRHAPARRRVAADRHLVGLVLRGRDPVENRRLPAANRTVESRRQGTVLAVAPRPVVDLLPAAVPVPVAPVPAARAAALVDPAVMTRAAVSRLGPLPAALRPARRRGATLR